MTEAISAEVLLQALTLVGERELGARVEIAWERYVKVGNIEASTAHLPNKRLQGARIEGKA